MIQEMQVCLVHGMKGGWASAYQVVPGIGSGVQLCPWGLPGCPAVRPVWAVGTLTCAGCRARGSQDSPHTAVAGSLRHTCSCCSDSGPGRCTPPAGYSDSPRWTSGTGRRSPRSQACNCIGHSRRSPSLENNRDHRSSLPCRWLGTGRNPPAILCPSLILPCKEDCSYSLLSFYLSFLIRLPNTRERQLGKKHGDQECLPALHL